MTFIFSKVIPIATVTVVPVSEGVLQFFTVLLLYYKATLQDGGMASGKESNRCRVHHTISCELVTTVARLYKYDVVVPVQGMC